MYFHDVFLVLVWASPTLAKLCWLCACLLAWTNYIVAIIFKWPHSKIKAPCSNSAESNSEGLGMKETGSKDNCMRGNYLCFCKLPANMYALNLHLLCSCPGWQTLLLKPHGLCHNKISISAVLHTQAHPMMIKWWGDDLIACSTSKRRFLVEC